MESLELVMLHNRRELQKDCFNVLQLQWYGVPPCVRNAILQRSFDELPMSLVLLDSGQVVGHMRLQRLQCAIRAVHVESVVVSRTLRGKGYGTRMMLLAERYMQVLGFEACYLHTDDARKFYEGIGYNICREVSVRGVPINDSWSPFVTDLKMFSSLICRGNISDEKVNTILQSPKDEKLEEILSNLLKDMENKLTVSNTSTDFIDRDVVSNSGLITNGVANEDLENNKNKGYNETLQKVDENKDVEANNFINKQSDSAAFVKLNNCAFIQSPNPVIKNCSHNNSQKVIPSSIAPPPPIAPPPAAGAPPPPPAPLRRAAPLKLTPPSPAKANTTKLERICMMKPIPPLANIGRF